MHAERRPGQGHLAQRRQQRCFLECRVSAVLEPFPAVDHDDEPRIPLPAGCRPAVRSPELAPADLLVQPGDEPADTVRLAAGDHRAAVRQARVGRQPRRLVLDDVHLRLIGPEA